MDPVTIYEKGGPWAVLLLVGVVVVGWLVRRDQKSDERTQAMVNAALAQCDKDRLEFKAEIKDLRANCGAQLKGSLDEIAGSLSELVDRRRARIKNGTDSDTGSGIHQTKGAGR